MFIKFNPNERSRVILTKQFPKVTHLPVTLIRLLNDKINNKTRTKHYIYYMVPLE